jgi:hypothetical protein
VLVDVHMAKKLEKMLGGFIKYLQGCDWKDRGYHRPAFEREHPAEKRPPSKPPKTP